MTAQEEVQMSKFRFSPRSVSIGLALAALLIAAFALAVTAQDPANDEAGDLPDQITEVEEVELLPGEGGSTEAVFYKRYSANVFVPDLDYTTYGRASGGCVYQTSGLGSTYHTLQLPDGATITYLRVYFYDNDPNNNAMASLYAYDSTGGATLVASANSSGTPGWGSAGSGVFSHAVDNMDETLALRLYYQAGTSIDLQICAVRVQYTYTLSRSSLPLILNEFNP